MARGKAEMACSSASRRLLDSYQVDLRAVICEWLSNQ